METLEDSRRIVFTEITADDPAVRGEYLAKFEAQAREFSDGMADAVTRWRALDAGSEKNEKHAYVSALTYSAITLHIQSMKLFLSGQPVASGNLLRQVIEAIALALICSGKLDVLDRFIEDKYSPNNAVRDACRHYEKLGILKDSVTTLRDAQQFYHRYSHPTKMTIASVTSLSGEGYYVGASFDDAKVAAYEKEVNNRVNLAQVFPSFIEAVKSNVAKWWQ